MCFLQMNRTTITFITTFFLLPPETLQKSHIHGQIYCKPAYKHKPEKRVNIKSKTTTYLLQITFQTAFKMTKCQNFKELIILLVSSCFSFHVQN